MSPELRFPEFSLSSCNLGLTPGKLRESQEGPRLLIFRAFITLLSVLKCTYYFKQLYRTLPNGIFFLICRTVHTHMQKLHIYLIVLQYN